MATECIIDGSHMRASDLDFLIVRYAQAEVPEFRARFDRVRWARELLERKEADYFEVMGALTGEDAEELRYLADKAESMLNDHAVERVYWIEDSCLYAADTRDES